MEVGARKQAKELSVEQWRLCKGSHRITRANLVRLHSHTSARTASIARGKMSSGGSSLSTTRKARMRSRGCQGGGALNLESVLNG